jgi:tagatose-6-phosphate ketose/aldose isomerase
MLFPGESESSEERRDERAPAQSALAGRPVEEQRQRGYADTLREICQQPATWEGTTAALVAAAPGLRAFLAEAGFRPGAGSVLLTGSGSSFYVGEALAPGLQAGLGLPVRAVPAGDLLTQPEAVLPPFGPALLVSFARSGGSPESRAALELCLQRAPLVRHLIITCNPQGALAREHGDDRRIHRVVLDELTNDRSLVMTSSFTNMALAGRALASLDGAGALARYERAGQRMAARARHVLEVHGEALGRIGGGAFRRAVVLGSGGRFGAAREASLKLLEMSAGRVLALPESYLGLRHGPMSALDEDTLVLAFVSSAPTARAYELDLLRELRRKRLGAGTILVGDGLPADLASDAALVVDAPGADEVTDDELVLTDVLVGQLLALHRCLALGLRPDAPSPGGVITRVVEPFAIHRSG